MSMTPRSDKEFGRLLRLALMLPGARVVLRYLLSRDSHHVLKLLVFEVDPDGFVTVVRAQEGAPLVEVLLANDAALLCHGCRHLAPESMSAVLKSLGVGDQDGLDALVRVPGFQANVVASPRLQAMLALRRAWELLRPNLPPSDPEREARYTASMLDIELSAEVPKRVLDLVAEGDLIPLAHGTLRFPCRHSLWTLIHEILLNEDYYFACDTAAPVIIDGGAHMGMALYYFKSRFPRARVTAFEPHPELHALALENVARNRWEGVEVLPQALAGTRCDADFHISESWSMAGSLKERRASMGDAMRTVTVQCVPLSDYLREPVDFLKLDIEGAEDEVLEEAAPRLHNVANIFCEFHQGVGLSSGRLARILALLEQANFDVQVGKSHNYQERSRLRPLTHFDGAASTLIWARRRYS